MVAEDVKPTLTGQGRLRIASERLVGGFRLFVLSALLLAGVGAIGRLVGWVALTATLGPTAYVLLAHPGSVGARWRNAVSGHVLAVAVGLGCLAVFGLWDHPSVADQHHDRMADRRSRPGRGADAVPASCPRRPPCPGGCHGTSDRLGHRSPRASAVRLADRAGPGPGDRPAAHRRDPAQPCVDAVTRMAHEEG